MLDRGTHVQRSVVSGEVWHALVRADGARSFRMNGDHYRGLIKIRGGAEYLHSLNSNAAEVSYRSDLKDAIEEHIYSEVTRLCLNTSANTVRASLT